MAEKNPFDHGDTSEEAFKRRVEELILYPPLSRIRELLKILDALAAKQRFHLAQAYDIAGDIDDFLENFRGEDADLTSFQPGDCVGFGRGRMELDTSSLPLAASIFIGDISDPHEPCPSCEDSIREDFWRMCAELGPREFFFLVDASGRTPPRVPVDLVRTKHALERIARRYGVEVGRNDREE